MTNHSKIFSSKLFQLNKNYVRAVETAGIVKFWDLGGGFQRKMKAEHFYSQATEIDDVPVIIEQGQFCLDDSASYPGIHDANNLWNGWTVPYFTKDDWLSIIKELNTNYEWIQVKFIDDKVFMKEKYGSNEWFEPISITHEGKHFYGFNGWCWTKDSQSHN